ncbi:MAG: hypothetical protein M1540_01005 [Candidatus Bathyarchaeota archaeon]|nr:hypothetical protein [Candidatus Bathyarchaeota archaeon]
MSITTAQAAETVQLGVAKGDVFEYSYAVTWDSTDSSLPIPSDVTRLSETQGFKITITDVSGTTLQADVLIESRDGSTKTVSGYVDVELGSISLPYGDLIVASNLNVNDKIYSMGGDATITGSVTRTYPSGDRPTNQRMAETTSENHYEKTDVYFDKAKGVAVSSYYIGIETIGSETETFTETITNTNSDVWTAGHPVSTVAPTSYPTTTQSALPTAKATQTPTQPDNLIPIAVLVIVIIIVVVVALLLVRGRGRKRKSRVDEEFAKYLKQKNS